MGARLHQEADKNEAYPIQFAVAESFKPRRDLSKDFVRQSEYRLQAKAASPAYWRQAALQTMTSRLRTTAEI